MVKESSNIGVLLCKGSLCAEGTLPVDEVVRYLQGSGTDLFLVVGDRLCEPGALSGRIPRNAACQRLVGTCSALAERVEEAGVPAWQVRIVDVRKEVTLSLTPSETAERIKLLLEAQVDRCRAVQHVEPDNLRLRPVGPGENLSRRELLRMTRPRVEVIPLIDHRRCGRTQGCGLCAESCSHHAIVSGEDGKRTIEKRLCAACGACVVACPNKASQIFNWRPEQILAMLEAVV